VTGRRHAAREVRGVELGDGARPAAAAADGLPERDRDPTPNGETTPMPVMTMRGRQWSLY
jgi:hypothetical protein